MIARIVIAVVVLLISYVGFVLANTPAAWVVAQARPRLAGTQASLSDVHGSAWHGNAELSFKGRDLGRLYWKASPWPLIGGNLDGDFIIKGGTLQLSGHVATGDKSTRLNNVKGQADLDLLATLLGLPAGLKGTLTANIDEVVINSRPGIQSATGRLVAHGVRIPDLGVGLGNLTLNLHDQGKNQGVRGDLRNSGGDIALRGTLMLTQTGAYVVQATLKPQTTGAKQNQIRDGLTAILGAADASGRFHYRTTGQLVLH
ncbi:MAG: type II secretion system protein N [Gammaproteobacteria bacterium]